MCQLHSGAARGVNSKWSEPRGMSMNHGEFWGILLTSDFLVAVDLESIKQAQELLAIPVVAILQQMFHTRQQLLVKHFAVDHRLLTHFTRSWDVGERQKQREHRQLSQHLRVSSSPCTQKFLFARFSISLDCTLSPMLFELSLQNYLNWSWKKQQKKIVSSLSAREVAVKVIDTRVVVVVCVMHFRWHNWSAIGGRNSTEMSPARNVWLVIVDTVNASGNLDRKL